MLQIDNAKILKGTKFWILPLIIVIGMFACKQPTPKSIFQKPNIILIMTDDQGWYDVGFNGNSKIKTPCLDSLAANGIILDRFYSASAVCSPTRASLITGRNSLRMDIPYANTGHLKEEEITIPEILQKEGYVTGHFGKWHLGTLTKQVPDANRGGKAEFTDDYSIPSEHGYDEYFSTESKVPTYDPMILPSVFEEGESKRYGWRSIENQESTKAYGTAYWNGENQKVSKNLKGDDSRIIMDRVIPFIDDSYKANKPFFTTIWFHTPHLPVVSDSIHRGHYSNLDLPEQIYYGTLTAMDEQIGRLWKKLKENELDKNTIIFFCSDNGPEFKTPGSAGVFRGQKRSLYEGGVRVPAFVVWKDHLKGGMRKDFPAVTSDYMPTILDILDIEYPDNRPIDGTSILDALVDNETEREKPIGFICEPHISWVTQQYKLIGDLENGNYELYDILNDKSEKKNIAEQNQELTNQLIQDLSNWKASVENSNKGIDYN
ncbi:Arylsulfatase A [Flagellimonas pacifica]|uniref:Arylsulfatase A n=2 Tax=Flagellimonas pacifica TaxID=1247520 RepID=A0A285MWP1_9FLAO|nr:Arylsulfatase A [Allomuricauda parva]